MLIILAVIMAASVMHAAGGIDLLMRIALCERARIVPAKVYGVPDPDYNFEVTLPREIP